MKAFTIHDLILGTMYFMIVAGLTMTSYFMISAGAAILGVAVGAMALILAAPLILEIKEEYDRQN